MLRERLVAFVCERTGLTPEEVGDDTALFSSGLLDSLSVVDFARLAAQSCGQHFPAADLTLDHLDTIGRLLRYAARWQPGA